jgi:hypothetical protein
MYIAASPLWGYYPSRNRAGSRPELNLMVITNGNANSAANRMPVSAKLLARTPAGRFSF